jgi:hypothetical protein
VLAGRWREGMAVRAILEDGTVEALVGRVVGEANGLPMVWWPDYRDTRVHHPLEHLQPAMDDPATLGAFLAIVREAYGDPCGWVQFRPDWGWEVVALRSPMDLHPTETEALVAALEAKQ